MNLRELTDEELDTHRVNVLIEQERRANIAAIPDQITALRAQYLEAGGDPAELDKES